MGTEAQCINTLNVPFAIQQIPTKAAIYILSGHWWVGSTYWLLISPTESNLDFPQHICDSGSSYKAILKVLPTRSCIMKNPSKGLWFPSFDLVMSIRWGRKEHSGGDLSALETPRVEVKPRSSSACPNHTKLKYHRIWVGLRQPGWEPNQCVFEWSLAGHKKLQTTNLMLFASWPSHTHWSKLEASGRQPLNSVPSAAMYLKHTVFAQ